MANRPGSLEGRGMGECHPEPVRDGGESAGAEAPASEPMQREGNRIGSHDWWRSTHAASLAAVVSPMGRWRLQIAESDGPCSPISDATL